MRGLLRRDLLALLLALGFVLDFVSASDELSPVAETRNKKDAAELPPLISDEEPAAEPTGRADRKEETVQGQPAQPAGEREGQGSERAPEPLPVTTPVSQVSTSGPEATTSSASTPVKDISVLLANKDDTENDLSAGPNSRTSPAQSEGVEPAPKAAVPPPNVDLDAPVDTKTAVEPAGANDDRFQYAIAGASPSDPAAIEPKPELPPSTSTSEPSPLPAAAPTNPETELDKKPSLEPEQESPKVTKETEPVEKEAKPEVSSTSAPAESPVPVETKEPVAPSGTSSNKSKGETESTSAAKPEVLSSRDDAPKVAAKEATASTTTAPPPTPSPAATPTTSPAGASSSTTASASTTSSAPVNASNPTSPEKAPEKSDGPSVLGSAIGAAVGSIAGSIAGSKPKEASSGAPEPSPKPSASDSWNKWSSTTPPTVARPTTSTTTTSGPLARRRPILPSVRRRFRPHNRFSPLPWGAGGTGSGGEGLGPLDSETYPHFGSPFDVSPSLRPGRRRPAARPAPGETGSAGEPDDAEEDPFAPVPPLSAGRRRTTNSPPPQRRRQPQSPLGHRPHWSGSSNFDDTDGHRRRFHIHGGLGPRGHHGHAHHEFDHHHHHHRHHHHHHHRNRNQHEHNNRRTQLGRGSDEPLSGFDAGRAPLRPGFGLLGTSALGAGFDLLNPLAGWLDELGAGASGIEPFGSRRRAGTGSVLRPGQRYPSTTAEETSGGERELDELEPGASVNRHAPRRPDAAPEGNCDHEESDEIPSSPQSGPKPAAARPHVTREGSDTPPFRQSDFGPGSARSDSRVPSLFSPFESLLGSLDEGLFGLRSSFAGGVARAPTGSESGADRSPEAGHLDAVISSPRISLAATGGASSGASMINGKQDNESERGISESKPEVASVAPTTETTSGDSPLPAEIKPRSLPRQLTSAPCSTVVCLFVQSQMPMFDILRRI